jgi:branched-chain amino acid transport system substrate-binding protein
MQYRIPPLILVFILSSSTAFAARADILIGVPGPITGDMAWFGEQMQEGLGMAVAELNATGGVLGQPVELLFVDDYCDAEQAVAAAHKLVAARVNVVIGNICSGAAIPASRIYEDAGILSINPSATNPKLTDQGLRTVFRIVGRDTVQGTMAADYLAERWGDQDIAIVHDGQAYGAGLAEAAKRRLNELGVSESMFETIEPGKADYGDLIDRLQASGIDALFFGGYAAESALIVRQARSAGYDLQLVGSDNLNSDYFRRVAGEASEGVRFPSYPDLRSQPTAATLVAKFRAQGYEPEGITLQNYVAVRVWAEAVEAAGSLELDPVVEALRTRKFDTLYGAIGFDANGDVTGYEPFVWYLWEGGRYRPVDPAELDGLTR